MPDKSHEESTLGLCSLIVCESIQSVHISMVLLRNLLVIWCQIRELAFDSLGTEGTHVSTRIPVSARGSVCVCMSV